MLGLVRRSMSVTVSGMATCRCEPAGLIRSGSSAKHALATIEDGIRECVLPRRRCVPSLGSFVGVRLVRWLAIAGRGPLVWGRPRHSRSSDFQRGSILFAVGNIDVPGGAA